MLESSHGNDKALPEAQTPLPKSMNVGKTMKEDSDAESAMQVRHVMRQFSDALKVGCYWKSQRSGSLLHGEAAFGCVVGRRDLS